MLPSSIRHGPAHDRDRLHDAARALEALVLKQLVTASNAFGGGQGAGSAIRADLFASTLADSLVKGGGIGLAAQLERTLEHAVGTAPPLVRPEVPSGASGAHLPAPALGPLRDPARALRGYGSPPGSGGRGLKEVAGRADDGSGAES